MKKHLAADQDYTTAQLPHTRKEVFFDICHLYGVSLIHTGLILSAFALPSFLIGYISDENKLAYLAIAQETADAVERAAVYQELQTMDSLFSLLDIIGYIVLFVGFSGAARIIRQHAWEEPVNLKLDLVKGIQQNVRAYLLLGFLTGCWGLLSRYCFINTLYIQGSWALLNLLPILVGVLIFLPVLGFTLVNSAIYSNSFGQNLRVALFLYLKKPVAATRISLFMMTLPLLSVVIPFPALRLILRITSVLMAPFPLLAWFLWCYNQLDAFINPQRYPELVGKGLAEKND